MLGRDTDAPLPVLLAARAAASVEPTKARVCLVSRALDTNNVSFTAIFSPKPPPPPPRTPLREKEDLAVCFMELKELFETPSTVVPVGTKKKKKKKARFF